MEERVAETTDGGSGDPLVEEAPQAMDISLIEGPPSATGTIPIQGERSFRYPNSGGAFYYGINITYKEAIQRKAARTKRFGLEGVAAEDPDSSIERRETRAKRFGTKLVATGGEPIKLVGSLPDIPKAKIRLEAVHLHGTNNMSTRDVFSYFKLYSPRNIEWVNDYSCNVVWEDNNSASRALLGMGRQPVALHSFYDGYIPPVALSTGTRATTTNSSKPDQTQAGEEEDQTGEIQEDQRVEQNQNDDGSQEDLIETQQEGSGRRLSEEFVRVNPSEIRQAGDCVGEESLLQERLDATPATERGVRDPEGSSVLDLQEGECVEGVENSSLGREEGVGGCPAVQWRCGESHPKAKMLLLRYATEEDVKRKGAAQSSAYYMKYGRSPVPAAIIAAYIKEKKEKQEEAVKEKQDLRSLIGQKRSLQQEEKGSEEEGKEEGEEGEVMEEEREKEADRSSLEDNPFASLVKRPKPLYSDRPNDLLDVTEMMGGSERERVLAELGRGSGRVGLGGGKGDLRRALQQRKKRRNLKLRIGYHPRLVEEKQ